MKPQFNYDQKFKIVLGTYPRHKKRVPFLEILTAVSLAVTFMHAAADLIFVALVLIMIKRI